MDENGLKISNFFHKAELRDIHINIRRHVRTNIVFASKRGGLIFFPLKCAQKYFSTRGFNERQFFSFEFSPFQNDCTFIIPQNTNLECERKRRELKYRLVC